MSIKINHDNWSDESKRSLAYGGSFAYSGSNPENYENAACRCIKCELAFVFTADEQKETYEVRKEYIWKRRLRCNGCEAELRKLQKRNKDLQEAWNSNGSELRKDQVFLNEWLDLLELIPWYGKRKNASIITMLRKILREPI